MEARCFFTPIRQVSNERSHPTADLRTERTTAGLMPSRFEFARHGKAGIEMSELLPNLATVADELCVIRSMYTTNSNHEQAWARRAENKNLPAFMVLTPDGGGFTTSGFLPAEFQGTSLNTFEAAPDKMTRFLRNSELQTAVMRPSAA